MSAVLRLRELPTRDRGGGVRTTFVVAPGRGASFTNGITEIDPGASLPLHAHDCEESVLVLEGDAVFETADGTDELGPGDATLVPEGVLHRFANRSSRPLRIFWVYGSPHPTRTLAGGETYAVGEEPVG